MPVQKPLFCSFFSGSLHFFLVILPCKLNNNNIIKHRRFVIYHHLGTYFLQPNRLIIFSNGFPRHPYLFIQSQVSEFGRFCSLHLFSFHLKISSLKNIPSILAWIHQLQNNFYLLLFSFLFSSSYIKMLGVMVCTLVSPFHSYIFSGRIKKHIAITNK